MTRALRQHAVCAKFDHRPQDRHASKMAAGSFESFFPLSFHIKLSFEQCQMSFICMSNTEIKPFSMGVCISECSLLNQWMLPDKHLNRLWLLSDSVNEGESYWPRIANPVQSFRKTHSRPQAIFHMIALGFIERADSEGEIEWPSDTHQKHNEILLSTRTCIKRPIIFNPLWIFQNICPLVIRVIFWMPDYIILAMHCQNGYDIMLQMQVELSSLQCIHFCQSSIFWSCNFINAFTKRNQPWVRCCV